MSTELSRSLDGIADETEFSGVVQVSRGPLFAGKVLPRPLVEEMVRPHNDVPEEDLRYGQGFWIRADRATVMLEGMDAGVSFRSAYDPPSEVLYTVISNTPSGAWPLVRELDRWVPDLVQEGG